MLTGMKIEVEDVMLHYVPELNMYGISRQSLADFLNCSYISASDFVRTTKIESNKIPTVTCTLWSKLAKEEGRQGYFFKADEPEKLDIWQSFWLVKVGSKQIKLVPLQALPLVLDRIIGSKSKDVRQLTRKRAELLRQALNRGMLSRLVAGEFTPSL
jgi:hypothetical protein